MICRKGSYGDSKPWRGLHPLHPQKGSGGRRSDGDPVLGKAVGVKNSIGNFGRVALDNGFSDRIGAADLAEHAGAGAGNTLLAEGIELDQAKAYSPAFVPLEVIHQRPVEVATHRDAFTDSP